MLRPVFEAMEFSELRMQLYRQEIKTRHINITSQQTVQRKHTHRENLSCIRERNAQKNKKNKSIESRSPNGKVMGTHFILFLSSGDRRSRSRKNNL